MKTRNNKGQFASGNIGKPKGAKNKVTSEQRERIEKVLAMLDETLDEDLEKMKAKERVDLWAALQEYIQPKLQRTQVEVEAIEEKVTKITFEVVGSGTKEEGRGAREKEGGT